jgi:hypothetical protein
MMTFTDNAYMNHSLPLDQLLQHFAQYVRQRLELHFSEPQAELFLDEIPVLEHPSLAAYTPSPQESVVLLCALAPHLQTNFYDALIQEYLPKGGEFADFGGVKGTNTRYMLPTGDTALFLLAGNDVARRKLYFRLFNTAHWFHRDHILWLEPVREGEPKMSGRLVLSHDFIELFIEGHHSQPAFGPEFPAKLISTRQTWEDLVLPSTTREHLQELHAWLHYNDTVMLDPVLRRKVKPGCRVLFHGPSGAGKTLAATLLGQEFNRPVYRIDLSQVVSKYIGETEKNLEKIFVKAERRNWILFFDEADALFGKRSNVQSAHDKYANQEVSYLLQRVEDFPGLVILASNFKSNIDNAFLRRFNAIIDFPLPGPAERYELWQKAMPSTLPVAPDVDLKMLADKHELTGSAINSVVHYAALQMHAQKQSAITTALLQQGILKELRKEDKLLRQDSRSGRPL